jgi:hypothetical protein
VSGEPSLQVALELLEQLQVGQLVGAPHQQQGALRQRGPRPEIASARLAEPPHLGVERQPVDGGAEAGQVVAERGGGLDQDGPGGPNGVHQLVPLPAGEGPLEAVVLERGVEVDVADGGAVGAAVAGSDGRHQPGAPAAVPAEEALQLGPTGREQQLLEER